MKTREKLVVVGNGMAACRTVEELLARAPGRYAIEIFGTEPEVNYNRIMLSPVLAGERRFEDIVLNGHAWYARHDIVLRPGVTIAAIDREARCVIDGDGVRYGYDRLIIATGSNPIRLAVPGASLSGVITFRDIADVRRMRAAAKTHRRAVVIGGGLLGLEAASGLKAIGMDVTLIHLMPTLMERQLDEAAGLLLQRALMRRGIKIVTSATTTAILGAGSVHAVRLADGREIRADLVVMAAGIRPNIALAREAGLSCERGIVVDNHMVTSDPRILAVGECVEHDGKTYGLVAPIWDMCKAAADKLAGIPSGGYEGAITYAKLKVTGIEVFSAGDFTPAADQENIVLRDTGRGTYRRLIIRNGKLSGAVLYGDTGDGPWYLDLIQEGVPVEIIYDRLIFGRAAVERETAYAQTDGLGVATETARLPADRFEPCPAQ